MKKLLLKYLLVSIFIISGLVNCGGVFAQTATFAYLSGGVQVNDATLTTNTQQVIFGFSAQVSGGSITFKQFNIGSNSGTPNALFANGTLFRSPTNSFNPAAANVAVGNVTISSNSNTTSFTIADASETITNSTNYYFLVVDLIGTGTCQPFINNMTIAVDVNNVNYNSGGLNTYNFYHVSPSTNYPASVINATTGVTATGSILTSGSTTLPLFGFGLTPSVASTFSTIKINSTVGTIGNYFTNFKLYSNSSPTFVGATAVAGVTASASGSYITFSGTIVATTTIKYYFLVADCTVTGSLPINVQFNFVDGQSSNALTRTLPSPGTYNTFTVYGNSYNINGANITAASLTAGTASGTLTANQTNLAVFGFSVKPSAALTLSAFNINSTNTPGNYFNNAKLYSSSNGNYSTGTNTLVPGATVTFSGNFAMVTGISESFTANQTKNYFLVADNYNGAASTTIAFNFTNGQSSNAMVESSPISSTYNTFAISGNTLTLPSPTFLVSSQNSTTTNGITSGSISYGQTDIVLFGFGVQGFGTNPTITAFGLSASTGANGFFSNGKLYRSLSPTFPGGTPLYTGISFPGSTVTINVSESIPSGTTYYYFLTGDYTVAFGSASSISFNMTSGQNPADIVAGTSYNTYNITGNSFPIYTNIENWKGTTSSDFSLASNFSAINGGNGFVPTSTTIVNIGGAGVAFTNQPQITATTTTIGGLTFGATGTPTLTIPSGKALTISNNLNLQNTSTTITGPGTLTLSSTAATVMSTSTALTLNGGVTVNNAGTFDSGTSTTINLAASSKISNTGTFTLGSTSVLNLNASTLANTGTFTLESDASSTAAIGPLVGASSITGNYKAQRFITGGSNMRGYRLLSSPTYTGTANSNNVYSINYVANSSYLTGTSVTSGGIDKAGNPSLWLFRENLTPNQSSFTSGNFRGVGSMGTTGTSNIAYTIDVDGANYNIPVGNGYLFFFRGDRSQATLANETVTSYVPTNTILSTLGPINTGTITFKSWYTPLVGNLLYSTTTTPAPGNGGIRGYNLAGNPYPSSINWTTVYGASTNVSPIMYQYNPATSQYGYYDAVHLTSTQNVSNIIGSGEGFFVIAASSSPAVLTFTEAAKASTSQPSTLLLGQPVGGKPAPQYVHLKMVKDAVNFDDVVISLSPTADSKYVDNEDAVHLAGNSPPETLTALSSDSVNLAGDVIPMPTATKPQTVRLTVNATASGLYTFTRSELVGIPALYEIWLKDNLQKDSLDLRANTTYSFRIDKNDATTFGANRFQVVLRENPALGLHLLDFTADKVTGVSSPQVSVNWKVENESNYTTFYVQRSTDGGLTFQSIGSLQSDGSGIYSFTDKSPSTGQNQYRLQLSDADNGISYSSIITFAYAVLSNANIATISLYPNPVHDMVNITVSNSSTNATASSYTITITNSSGTVMSTSTSSQSTWQNNVSALLPGTYFIRVVDNNSKAVVGSSKFVKL